MCRDVKSSNILLTKDGQAKLADVGLALMADYFSSAGDTAAGTFAYAAPELLMGEHCGSKVSTASDPAMPSAGLLPDQGDACNVPGCSQGGSRGVLSLTRDSTLRC